MDDKRLISSSGHLEDLPRFFTTDKAWNSIKSTLWFWKIVVKKFQSLDD